MEVLMKKILMICFSLLLFLGGIPVYAEDKADELTVEEILLFDDYEAIANYLNEGGEERLEWFKNSCSEEEWFRFLYLQQQYAERNTETGGFREAADLSVTPEKLGAAGYNVEGVQSGVFSEGEGVSESDRKYVYKHNTDPANLLSEVGVNEETGRLNMGEGADLSVRRFILWAPNWGQFKGEQVGVEIIVDKLLDRGNQEFMFAGWGNPFHMYLENSLQSKITVNFYKNVDRSSKVPNGEKVIFDTTCDHLLFSAIGLTNETDLFDSIEYSAPADENAGIYTVVPVGDLSTAVHNGRTVYYNNKPQHNADVIYEMKGKDSAEIYVGIMGQGDGSMMFVLGFTSYGVLPQAYCLSLDPNGGKLSGEAMYEGTSGSKVEIKDPVYKGHVFKGWTFTKENGTLNGKEYTFGNGNAALKANWAVDSYPITYKLNGGTNHPSNPSSYTSEDDITILDPTRTGYVFKGWKEGNRIPKGSSGEKTFTASWEKEVYPIEYVLNGGTNHPSNPSQYTVEDEVDILDASRNGYVFQGWKEGKKILKGSTGKKTFTAEWKAETYPIDYVLNGGTNHPSNPSSYTSEDDITILDPSRTGYVFKGWKEGNTIPKGSTGKKIFTAVWEAEIYPIEYALGGGENHPENPSSYTAEDELMIRDAHRTCYRFVKWKEGNTIPKGSTGKKIFTAVWEAEVYPIDYVLKGGENHPSNPASYTAEDDITILDPSRSGYIFRGWEEGDRIPKGSTGKKTFTANWEAEVYPIEYVLGGGENDPSNPVKYTIEDELTIKDAHRKGYTFKGWKEGSTIPKGSTGKKTFTAVWEAEVYPIEYVLNGGKNDPSNPISYTIEDDLMIKAAKKEGYLFTGWEEGDHIPKGSSGKKIFTAKWEAEIYPVTYVLNGGTNHPSNPSSYTVEDEIRIQDASKEGYRFLRWEEGDLIPKGSTGEKTFTAVYEKVYYPVIYELNGGENHPSNPIEYTIEDEYEILEPSRPNYRFLGWKEGNRIPRGSTGGKLFTALWEAEIYPITYELCGGFNDPSNPFSYTVEDDVIIHPAKKEGYVFTGWLEGNFIPKGSTGSRHFTTQFEPMTYPIHYDLGGGSNDPENPDYYTIEEEVILKDPHKDDSVFERWEEGDRIPKGSTGEKSFRAVWRYKVVNTASR